MRRAGRDFFGRDARTVARQLVGAFLVRERDGERTRHMIVETEAYVGPHDLASHSARKRSARTDVMYGPAGVLYVYFTYGMHWLMNVVTGKADYPAGVLIRSIEDVTGPARLTKFLGIDGRHNGKPLGTATGIWIELPDKPLPSSRIMRTPRIGVDYAGPVWANKPYRYVLTESAKSGNVERA